jgi:acyl-CoA synthetase (NDP forming)
MKKTIDLDSLFYPKSIAMIGASPNIIRDRAGFFNSFRECYTGALYPINPKYDELHGIRCYPKITDVPERVDYAVIMLPRDKVKGVLSECVEAKVRFVLVFTSGFSEMGDASLENELLQMIEGTETRIVGPNCIGAHCPESGMVYYSQLNSDRSGIIGYFSQSGGHALNFLIRGISMGLEFNKVISLGNQADLRIEDFLEYFAHDDRIKHICGYVEDIKEGRRFFDLARKTITEFKKPLILWKGGRSADGARATQSHTGAMAMPTAVWDSLMNQLGIINAETQEEMGDILLALKHGFLPRGKNVCIVVMGGGSSVELTDAVSLNGLSVPTLSPAVQELVGKNISRVNTSTKNPVDLGMFGMAPDVIVNAAVHAATDPAIDMVLVCQYPEMIKAMVPDHWEFISNTIVDGLTKVEKPLVVVIPRLFQNNPDAELARAEFTKKLEKVHIPSYSSAERAARAATKLCHYLEFMDNHGKKASKPQ